MVERCERAWIGYFAALVIVVTSLPYIIGYSSQGADWRFSGFVFGVEDGHSYIAKMLGGAQGDWLFRTPYTAYPQNGFLSFFPYLLLGKLTAPPGQHEQLVALFHLFRAVGVLLMTFATYDFISLLVADLRWRRLGTLLGLLGGGLGWLSLFGLSGLWVDGMPLEFYSPETFGFLSAYGLPHLATARALLLWSLVDYLRQAGSPWTRWQVFRTALIWTVLGLMQPMTIAIGWAVIGAHLAGLLLWSRLSGDRVAAWQTWKGYFWRALWTGVLSAPLVVYTMLSFRLDPFLRGWEGQNIIRSPIITHYLLGFALVLPFALLGARLVLRLKPAWGLLLVSWMVIFPLLAYAPFNLQRRLPEGIFVALTTLAMVWVEHSSGTAQRWTPRLLALGTISSLLLVIGGCFAVLEPSRPLFVPAAEVRGFLFLSETGERAPVVLADFDTSNAMPAWTPVRLLTGHGPESYNGKIMRERVVQFYQQTTTTEEREALLREFNVQYVVWKPSRAFPQDPGDLPGMEMAFQNDAITIYRYRAPSH